MHFNDDNYAAYQLGQCSEDQRKFNDPLTIISLIASAIVFTLRIRHEEYRKFPDNTFTVTLYDRNAMRSLHHFRQLTLSVFASFRCSGTMCGLHGSMFISAVTKSKVVLLRTYPWPTVCKVQATLIHWFTCAAVWTVISVMVTIYLIVVRQVPAQQLAKHTNTFYASLLLIPSAAVVACWSFGGYGPFPGLDNCWINQGIDRFLYFHTFTILGVVISLTLGPITGCFLWRAYRGVSNRTDHARVFRVMLVRQVLLACYGFLMSVAFLLGGVNTLILKIDSDAHKTWYVKRTAYAYCMLGAVNFSTLGLFVAIIFFSTKSKGRELLRALKRLCCSACSEKNRAWDLGRHGRGGEVTCQPSLQDSSSKRELNMLVSQNSRAMTSPRSPGGRLLFPSAFDSGGQTALSVPPDPRARRVQQQAITAYTSTLLAYAREQLLEGSFISDDSDVSTSSSFSSNRSFLDSRRRGDSLGELIFHTDASGSLPSSPRSAPYYLHEDSDDNTAECSHRRIDLRDVIIHDGGVGTTEL